MRQYESRRLVRTRCRRNGHTLCEVHQRVFVALRSESKPKRSALASLRRRQDPVSMRTRFCSLAGPLEERAYARMIILTRSTINAKIVPRLVPERPAIAVASWDNIFVSLPVEFSGRSK